MPTDSRSTSGSDERSDELLGEHCSAQTIGIADGKYSGGQTDRIAINKWNR